MSFARRLPWASKVELQELTHESRVSRDELRERVGSVLEEVARLEHLVSGLLVLSRLDAGETRSKWVEVDLAELASGTAEQMHLIAEDRGVEIDLSALHIATTRGDRAQLKQVVVNLLDNASRFTKRGGTCDCARRPMPPAASSKFRIPASAFHRNQFHGYSNDFSR